MLNSWDSSSFHIDLGDTSVEKNNFCICRYHSFCFFLCSKKPSTFISNLCALAQASRRIALPSSREYNVPVAERDLLEFAVPEVAEVVSGRMNIKTAPKSVGRRTLRKHLGEGSRRRKGTCVREAGR